MSIVTLHVDTWSKAHASGARAWAMQFRIGMMRPLQITFRNMHSTQALDDAIRTRVARLCRLAPDIDGVAVVVERPHRQHRHGNLFAVVIQLTLPHGKIVVGTDPDRDHAHEDVLVAVVDAFRAARRAVVEWLRAHRAASRPAAPPL